MGDRFAIVSTTPGSVATATGLSLVTAASAAAARTAIGAALAYTRAPTAPSCVARWLLSDTGAVIADSVGSNPLAYSGSATYEGRPSPWGACIYTGGLAAGECPKGATTLEPIAITAFAWIRPYSYPGTPPYILLKRQNDATWGAAAPNDGAIGFFSSADGIPVAYVQGAGGVTTATPSGVSRRTPLDVWSLACLTYDDTNGLFVYIDGQLAASSAAVGAIDYASHGSWCLGANNTGTGVAVPQAYDGFERDVQICDAALTATQILEHYQRCIGTYEGA